MVRHELALRMTIDKVAGGEVKFKLPEGGVGLDETRTPVLDTLQERKGLSLDLLEMN